MTKVTIIKNDDNITNRSGRDIQYDDKYYIIMEMFSHLPQEEAEYFLTYFQNIVGLIESTSWKSSY